MLNETNKMKDCLENSYHYIENGDVHEKDGFHLQNCVDKTQLTVRNYQIRATRGRGKYRGDLIEFVRKGFTCKRPRKNESLNTEVICPEVTISNKK